MKLSKADREYIRRNFWESEDSIDQIERCIDKTKFTLDGKKIPTARAIEMLGREKFLTGMDRSAFHFTTVVETDDGRLIHFDSSRFFKGVK